MIKPRNLLAGVVAALLFIGGPSVYADETGQQQSSSIKDFRLANKSLHNMNYSIIKEDQIPEALESWVTRSQTRSLLQTKIMDDGTYVLITRGMKHSGGYDVEISSIQRDEQTQTLWVKYKLIDPGKDDLVTEEITYPSILIRLDEHFQDEIRFKEVEDRDIAQLDGVSYLPEVIKETDNIMLSSPAQKKHKVYIQGFIRGFEGIINYKLVDDEGKVRSTNAQSATKAAPKWGKFEYALPDQWIDSAELEVSVQITGPQTQVKTEKVTLSIDEIQNYLGHRK